jgi:nucleoside-diphosphate-sugar epimerase/glycosyltransferase involved in cell wall biosynthesis
LTVPRVASTKFKTVAVDRLSSIATLDESPVGAGQRANDRGASRAPLTKAQESAKPTVLMLNRSYWPDAEATGQLLTELCEDLAKDFEITVVAGQPNQNPAGISYKSWGAESHKGVTIQRVPHLTLGKKSFVGRGLSMVTYFVGAAVTVLFAARPEVVVVETDPFLLPLLGRCLQWWYGCRLVVYLQDIYPDVAIAVGKVRDGWFTRLLRRRLFSVYRNADRVIVLGEDMRAILTAGGIPDERIISLPNWVDTTRIYPIPLRNSFRLRERLEDKFIVMYSGNMGLCQNLDEILETAELLSDRPNIEFVMVGGGASRARLEETARSKKLSNVRFLPYQPLAELTHSLSAADLHLVPLDPRVTGCLVPSKLYGILAAGVPALVIADERSEASRVVRESDTGRVIPPGSPRQLAETILWCADHESERKEMGRRARRLAEREYDRRRTTGRFGTLLKNVVAGDSAPIETRADAWISVRNEPDVELHHADSTAAASWKVARRMGSRDRFLKGKRIVVTGGAGFLGRFVCRGLERFDPSEIIVPRIADYDLRDRDAVRDMVRDTNPGVIIHLAAVADALGAERVNAGRHFYENVLMGLQLMEEARLAGVAKFVSVGNFRSCPQPTDVPLSEDPRGDDSLDETFAPSGLAKKMLLVQAQAYRQQYGLNAITLLPVNVYGPRDNFDCESSDIIPRLIRKVVEARDAGQTHIDVENAGDVSREFMFVRDAARGIALAAERYNKPEPVRLGSGREIPTRDLAEMICELGAFSGEIRWDQLPSDGTPQRRTDTSLAEREFGFRASTSLRDGLITTLAWYERHQDEIVARTRSTAAVTQLT